MKSRWKKLRKSDQLKQLVEHVNPTDIALDAWLDTEGWFAIEYWKSETYKEKMYFLYNPSLDNIGCYVGTEWKEWADNLVERFTSTPVKV